MSIFMFKQVQSKVTFPKAPKVSYACRALISRILVPQRSRVRIREILEDNWVIDPVVSVQTSSTTKSFERLSSEKPNSPTSEGEETMIDRMVLFKEQVQRTQVDR